MAFYTPTCVEVSFTLMEYKYENGKSTAKSNEVLA